MRGLQTTRVIVVDDNAEEGMAFLKALSKIGVGALFFDAKVEDLPEDPVHGIRLLVLDMELIGGTGDPIPQTLATVLRLISKDNGPFIIIAWTERPELVRDFQERLFREIADVGKNCIDIVHIVKSDVKDGDGNFDIARVAKTVTEHIIQFCPLEIIMAWEQNVHDATSETIRVLGNFAYCNPEIQRSEKHWDHGVESKQPLVTESTETQLTSPSTVAVNDQGVSTIASWSEGMSSVLATLANAVAGKNKSDLQLIVLALFDALNRIHVDSLERISASNPVSNRSAKKLKSAVELKRAKKAGLNEILVTSVVGIHKDHRPGNVYICEPNFAKTLIWDSLRCNDSLCEQVLEEWSIIMVEITPSCDFAQRKHQMLRFVFGLVVPDDQLDKVKQNADFLWRVGPVALQSFEGIFHIVLNAHFLNGCLPKEFNLDCCFRLRKQALVDLQSWFARHSARPGYISVADYRPSASISLTADPQTESNDCKSEGLETEVAK